MSNANKITGNECRQKNIKEWENIRFKF